MIHFLCSGPELHCLILPGITPRLIPLVKVVSTWLHNWGKAEDGRISLKVMCLSMMLDHTSVVWSAGLSELMQLKSLFCLVNIYQICYLWEVCTFNVKISEDYWMLSSFRTVFWLIAHLNWGSEVLTCLNSVGEISILSIESRYSVYVQICVAFYLNLANNYHTLD